MLENFQANTFSEGVGHHVIVQTLVRVIDAEGRGESVSVGKVGGVKGEEVFGGDCFGVPAGILDADPLRALIGDPAVVPVGKDGPVPNLGDKPRFIVGDMTHPEVREFFDGDPDGAVLERRVFKERVKAQRSHLVGKSVPGHPFPLSHLPEIEEQL